MVSPPGHGQADGGDELIAPLGLGRRDGLPAAIRTRCARGPPRDVKADAERQVRRTREAGSPWGEKAPHLPREGKARLSRRRNFHDLTAGEAVNRLVSTTTPACSRLFGPHAVASSLKTYPGALSTGAAANEKQRPLRVAFFMSPTPAATS